MALYKCVYYYYYYYYHYDLIIINEHYHLMTSDRFPVRRQIGCIESTVQKNNFKWNEKGKRERNFEAMLR